MRCPECGAQAGNGPVCVSCGIPLPRAAGRPPAGGKPAGERGRRSGTLGDFFQRSPHKAAPAPAKPPRRQASAPAQPVRMGRPPAAPPLPAPPPAAPAAPVEDVGDSWEAGYAAVWGTRQGAEHEPPPDESDDYADDAWRSESGWNVVPTPGMERTQLSGSLSARRHKGPMVSTDKMARMRAARYATGAPQAPSLLGMVIGGSSRLLISLLAVAAVVLVLGVPTLIGLNRMGFFANRSNGTPVSQTTPQPTVAPPQGFSGASGAGFSIAAPDAWQRTSRPVTVQGQSAQLTRFSDGKGTSLTVITAGSVPVDALQGWADNVAAQIEPGSARQPVTTAQQARYNNVDWLERISTQTETTATTAVQMRLRALAAERGATTYLILLVAPDASFGGAATQYFEPMLSTFRFA